MMPPAPLALSGASYNRGPSLGGRMLPGALAPVSSVSLSELSLIGLNPCAPSIPFRYHPGGAEAACPSGDQGCLGSTSTIGTGLRGASASLPLPDDGFLNCSLLFEPEPVCQFAAFTVSAIDLPFLSYTLVKW